MSRLLNLADECDGGSGRARRVAVHAFASLWLATLVGPTGDLFAADHAPMVVALGCLGATVFVVAYLWQFWHHPLVPGIPAGTDGWSRRVPPALLTGLAAAMTAGFGREWFLLFYFAAVSTGFTLPDEEGRRGLLVVLLLALGSGLAAGVGGSEISGALLTLAGLGFLMITLARQALTVRELEAARAEVSGLAVANERLRFARDLHDLLGHSLSLIALKSELAGRLVSMAPERAKAEIQDVEQVARTALREVRETIAGYRQPTLAEEIAGARELLGAAGIGLTVRVPDLDVPPTLEAALAWTVREGVTNVMRHSHARHCTVRVALGRDATTAEVIDDGPRDGERTTSGGGSGLVGLTERLRALGGLVEAGPLPGGGFRLAAILPHGGTVSAGP